jgi:transcriptional regulator with XRE-family HTH domain
MTVKELRHKRVSGEIPATVLASKAKVNRSRLSQVECGYITPTNNELARLATALDDLIRAKGEIQKTAAAFGWPALEVA